MVSDSKENGITPITDFDANIQLLIELAKNTSKVVDENGEPLVVYHGTKAEFAIFEASHNHKANKGFF